MADNNYEDKIKTLVLGAVGRPYPALVKAQTEAAENGEITSSPQTLGVLENPILFPSKRSYAEAMGLAYRDMPTPSMLPVFLSAMDKRREDSIRKTQFVLGPPGTGKTYLAKLIGKMQDKKGALVVDCGGKNLEELLFETIIDESSKDIYDRIEKKLASGTMNPVSVGKLKKGLGDAFSEETFNDNGTEKKRYAIDWDKVGRDEKTSVSYDTALDALNNVAKAEGLDGKGEGISLATQEGPIIKAWKSGRPIILDEYNRHKPDTDAKLQILWQLFIGEIKEHKVEGGAGQSFTFKRSEMPKNFFVTLTGNSIADGGGVIALSESAYSRLRPEFIPIPDEKDWQHRICQTLCDVPLSTLYECGGEQWQNNPEQFTAFVKNIQTLGRSENEIKNIPEWQKDMADNWQGTIKASAQLAKFYNEWAKYMDPEQTPADLMSEVDEDYSREVNVGMRMMLSHINQAIMKSPSAISIEESKGFEIGDWSQEPVLTVEKKDDGNDFGTRLSNVIIEEIDRSTRARGKYNLHSAVMKLAADNGIIDMKLYEGAKGTVENLATLLDIKPKKVEVTMDTYAVQAALCDFLREKNPEISERNDDIATVVEVQKSLDKMLAEKTQREMGNRDRFLCIPNPDFLNANSEEVVPFVLVPVIEGLPSAKDIKEQSYSNQIDSKQLLDQNTFLRTIAIPKIGEGNLKSLWNQAFTEATKVKPEEDASFAMAQKIHTNDNDGFGITTVVCAKENGQDTTRMNIIVRDGEPMQGLIAGDGKIGQKTAELLKNAGLLYVDINQKDAPQQINKQLSNMTSDMPENTAEQVHNDLLDAFKFRNKNLENGKKEVLVDALTSKKQPTAPIYIAAAKGKDR